MTDDKKVWLILTFHYIPCQFLFDIVCDIITGKHDDTNFCVFCYVQSHNHQFLGDGSGAIPDFPDIELTPGMQLPEDCTLEDVDTLRSIYREHCEVNIK